MREPAAAFIGGAVGALARAGVLEALPHEAGRTALAPAYAAVSLAAAVPRAGELGGHLHRLVLAFV